MNKKIIIVFIILLALLFVSPAFAKEVSKIEISTDEHPFPDKGYIVIKVVDKEGYPVYSKGTIFYNITDSEGNYHWEYKPYDGELRLKYDIGKYNVKVKFKGDSNYKKSVKIKDIIVTGDFNPYTYYDDHFWGLDQEIDDYIEYNYWDEEIYDAASNYDGEGY